MGHVGPSRQDRTRRRVAGGLLVASGLLLGLLGAWVTTWEADYHAGSVWNFANQRDMAVEPWSAAAIRSNRDLLVVAGALGLSGLVGVVVGAVRWRSAGR